MLSGIDNWLPALLLPLLPVLSRPCTRWMGRVLELTGENICHLMLGAALQIISLLGHVTLGCAIALAGGDTAAMHVWRCTLAHWTWHRTPSDLLEYHTARQCCSSLDVHAIAHVALLTRVVVGPAEVDMMQHVIIWFGGILRDTAVSAVCSPLDVMLSRAVLVDSLEKTVHSARRYFASVWRCYQMFSVVESTWKDEWPYHFGHALTDFLKELAWRVFDGDMRWIRW